MRIAYLSSFYPLRGGIAQYNASLKKAFEARGCEVAAFTFSRQYPDLLFPGKSQYIEPGEEAEKVDSRAILDTINPISWQRTASAIKAFKPDILFMKYWMSWFAPSLGTVAWQMPKETKVISVLDNVLSHEKRPFDKTMSSWFLNKNDGFLVMSEKVKEDMLSLKSNAKYLFHPHPLYDHFGAPADPAMARKKLGIETEKKVLLFFGFIRAYKGLDLLIEAMQFLDESYVLLAAGESYEDIQKYKSKIDSSAAKDRIILHDQYISDSETPNYFAASDACLLPYKSATQSGIALIAYHFGLPIIATDVGGLKEYVKDGQTGVLVDQPTPEQIAEGIKRYFKLGGRKEFSAKMDAGKAEMSWDHLAGEILKFNDSL
ncbi:MAG: glycosyltransferase involved in cell wall biosynthesis [Limisphaerales bacterium]|jgi:glycosyltransferase involved in cell wall biosynthesis